MAYRFVHIGIAFPGVAKVRDLEPVISMIGIDWVRYAGNCWISWTDQPIGQIYMTIKRQLDIQDQLLVAPLSVRECVGNLSPFIWEWLKKYEPGIVVAEAGSPLQQLLNHRSPTVAQSQLTGPRK